MTRKIVERILAGAGAPELLRTLVGKIAPTDLISLLLEVMRARAASLGAAEVLAQHERSALVAPSTVDARRFRAVENAAFEAARAFEPIVLSPVQPLGVNAVLGGIDQNNVLSTVRGAEAVADPTTSLALECAPRRRRDRKTTLRFCASVRAIRMQKVDFPGFTPHFGLFALVTAGRGDEVAMLREHVLAHVELLESARALGAGIGQISVEISDTRVVSALLARRGLSHDEVRKVVRAHAIGAAEELLARRSVELPREVRDVERELGDLEGCAPELSRLQRIERELGPPLVARGVRFAIDAGRLEGLSYYKHLCLRVSAVAPDGAVLPIGDGGFTTWLERLLGDRKERFLSSGLGLELVCKRYW